MVAESAPVEVTPHAIQLNYVGIKELTFRSDRLPATLDLAKLEGPHFQAGRTDYDPVAKTIQISTRIDLSLPEQESFAFRVELVSQFTVDDTAFPAAKVNDWADRAAFYVVFPYLREEVYALSIRVGLKPPILLPLLQIPTFKVEAPTARLETAGAI